MFSGNHGAFTLVELLIVVTIIVILLTLLTPAMDRAIYQAEMLQCGARLSAIGRSATAYTVDFRRAYPYRANVHARGWKPNVAQVATDASSDERPVLTRALGALNPILNDPFLDDVDYEGSVPESNIEVDYNLWFGFGYRGKKGMYRLGDRFDWGVRSFAWIAADIDVVPTAGQAPSFIAGHGDAAGRMTARRMQDEGALGGVSVGPAAWTQYTLSRWELTDGVTIRGTLDKNIASTDGSVARFDGVSDDDDRMARTPCTADPTQFTAAEQYIPR